MLDLRCSPQRVCSLLTAARRKHAYQRGRVGLLCRLLAAMVSVPKPRPNVAYRRAAMLVVERA